MSEDAHNDEPLADPPAPPPDAPPPPVVAPWVVPRWMQLVALPLGLLALYAILKAAGVIVLLFVTAAVIALILTPLVSALQRFHFPRVLAIFAVYIGFLALLTGMGILLANPISDQVTTLRNDIPSITDSANRRLADVQDYFDRHNINIEIKKQGQTALQTLQDKVIGGTDSIVSFGTDLLTKIVTAGAGLILVLVLSVYMLIHGQRIGHLVRRAMPPGNGSRDDDYPSLVVRAVAGYVRGQLLFSCVMGAGAGIGLWIYGITGIFPDGQTYALAFGVFFGLMELVPYVGPFLGAAPPVLVALFQDPLTAVWVALLFIGLQQIEGHVASPLIFGHALRINPLLVIFALLFGFELFGILGSLVALPVAAVVRETVVYLRRHLVLEPWGTMSPLEEAGIRAGRRLVCSECGAELGATDAFCRACGAEVSGTQVPSGR
jgi:predicted PurR-regulated permease PerM/ribosomal protein L40E